VKIIGEEMSNNEEDKNLIAYGGLYCGDCSAYKGKVADLARCTITSTFPAYNPQQYLEHIPNISIV